ncbi:LysR family transcriptional regulator [Celerinatantimonas diazotrophica]|uniref:DNA-binding transcriptional LysR family regulator n=1 Tax=Celerinatantimonas diazotrophica TaxID=412034 RepID=A0A4R1K1L8_9GAMM|nr:LysR family transcriptional regulator [Celerinatantimonas diazotrophica]TCK57862.1 DNA-binding transcriptional LysR family regulator [Celerinatantimonas diazotrophica]CAG9298072.1 HTH-type transcriptional regulator DmlR [Celerinatantimonas diazotrophica]
MNWDNLRYFLCVARTGSARAAALKIGVDQATVARRLQALEQALDTQLFYRHRDGYQLTEAGTALIAEAELMESSAKSIQKKVCEPASKLSGKICIATTDALAHYFVLEAITQLKKTAPKISYTILANIKLANMRQEDVDIAIRSERPTDNGLIVKLLKTTTLGFFASESYLRHHGEPKKGSGFSGHQLVMYHQQTLPKYWQTLCGESINHAQIALETDSQNVLIEGIRKGLGIGVLSTDIVASHYPDLIQIMTSSIDIKEIWLVIHPDSHRTPRTQKLVEAITALFD